jgi:hypothetical protein
MPGTGPGMTWRAWCKQTGNVEGSITLEKKAWTPSEEIKVPGPDERTLVHHGGERLEWQVVGRYSIMSLRGEGHHAAKAGRSIAHYS